MSKKYQLPNGLTVILNQSHKSPVVSVQMWVRTGSADEKKGEEGISHFIEHLVFKGTKEFGVGEIAATVEGSGGELNAYTSFDQTVFYVTISKQYTDVALKVISQMMGYPTFDEKEIDNEREVVIEEIKRGQDSFGRQSSQLLFSQAYRGHPYGIPVIGYDKVIRKVSKKKMLDYFHSRYVPSNMFLVVSGDFELSEMKDKVKRFFGGFHPYKLKKVVRAKEKPQTKPQLKVQRAPFEEASFHLSWKIPNVRHADMPAIDILALVLGQGDSSRLVHRMRIEQALVNSVYASTFSPLERGLFVAAAVFNADKLDEILRAFHEELAKILREPIAEEELVKALTNIESEEFYGMETVDGLSRKTGHLEFLMKDPEYFPKYMKQVYRVSREDVLRVARKYLRAENLNITALLPNRADQKETEKKFKSWIKEFGRLAAEKKPKVAKLKPVKKKKIQLKKAGAKENKVQIVQLGPKAKVLLRPCFDTPTLSVKIAHLGGMRREDPKLGGLTELLSRTWSAGTEKQSEREIHVKLENWASALSAFGGRNTAGLSLESLTPFESDIADLFVEILIEPRLSEDVIEREKTVMREQIKNRDDSPAQKAMLKFMELLFGDHPYSRDPKGSMESLAAIRREHLVEHWKKMVNQSNFVATVSGYVDVELWREKLKAALNHLPKTGASDREFEHRPPTEDLYFFEKLEKEQSHIVVGVKGLTFTDEERYALELIQSVLAGQGGRLFIELRDKASLAYTVSPMKMEGIDTGYFGAYIGCSPEKGKQAIQMLRRELQRLAEAPVPPDELLRSKRYLIGRHDIDLQRNSAVANGLLFTTVYGVDHDELFTYADHVNAVTPQQVRDLAARLFSQKFVTVAAGSLNPF